MDMPPNELPLNDVPGLGTFLLYHPIKGIVSMHENSPQAAVAFYDFVKKHGLKTTLPGIYKKTEICWRRV
jgi:hypothetical protein